MYHWVETNTSTEILFHNSSGITTSPKIKSRMNHVLLTFQHKAKDASYSMEKLQKKRSTALEFWHNFGIPNMT